MERTVLKGRSREALGKRASARQRNEGWIPANLYGHGQENLHFQVPADEFRRLIHEGHHMLALDIDGRAEEALLRELQFDALGENILHADFTRVSREDTVEIHVPIHTYGVPKGLTAGAIVDQPHHEVTLRGKAHLIPEHLTVEIDGLHPGESIRVRDLDLPEGVTCLIDADEPVVIVHHPRGIEEVEAGAEEAAEPEVIGEPKPEKEEEGE